MATIRMIDIAVNFTDSMFKGIYNGKHYHVADIPAVLSRAWSAGVERIIVTGGSLEESREALAISETDGRLFCTVGVHPTRCMEFDESGDPEQHFQALLSLAKEGVEKGKVLQELDLMNKLALIQIFSSMPIWKVKGSLEDALFSWSCRKGHKLCVSSLEGYPTIFLRLLLNRKRLRLWDFFIKRVVAIGECGLDYDRLQFCRSEIQKKYFEKQFELADAMKLPMFLHMRAAAEDFCEILARNKERFRSGVVHSFTGSAEDRDKLLSFTDLFIGVNGCSLKTVENLDVVRGIPVERMMIETDSPYCEIKNTHAGINLVKSVWSSKKKDKYDPNCIVKGRNEPCLVRQVVEVVAGCKGVVDVRQLSETLYHNTCRVFFPHDLDSMADALLTERHDIQ